MAALARAESNWLPSRAASTSVLPVACRPQKPQRAFSENTTKRDIPTFVRARIREFEAVLPRPFYLWSAAPAASRWRHRLDTDGDTAHEPHRGRHRARSQAARECVGRRGRCLGVLRFESSAAMAWVSMAWRTPRRDLGETHKKITKTKKAQAEKSS